MTALALLVTLLAPAPPAHRVPVRHPSLDGLDPAVSAQLREVSDRLRAQEREGRASAEAYGDAGRHYHAYDMATAAEDCYRNAEALAPADFRWPYLRALLLEQDSRPEEAARSLERALASGDTYYPALVRLAALHLTLGRPADSEGVLARARRHAPDDPALLAVLGEQALAKGRFGDAITHLRKALDREPRATRLHYPLAMAYRSMGRLADAEAALARAGTAGIRPRDPVVEGVLALRRGAQVHVLEAERAFQAGDYQAAAAAYRRALDAAPEPTIALLLGLAAAESKLERFPEALARLEQARRIAPENEAALYNAGVLLAHLGRHVEAEAILKDLVERNPGDAAARVELALTLVALDRVAEAKQRLEPLAPATTLCPVLLERLESREAAAGRARELAEYLRRGPCAR